MNPSSRIMNASGAVVRLLSVACALAASAHAQEAPYAEFQYATVTGSNNVINISMLPIVIESGAVVYKNMTVQFEVSSSGAITLVSGSPTTVAAPTPQISSFEAGVYAGPSTLYSGETLISVAGPGVTVGGSTEWSIATSSGASACTYPASATFYVGPITSNPLYARLKAAGITSTAYTYGILGSVSCASAYWHSGGLIGLSQTGNALTIVTFSDSTTTDYSTPRDQITYMLKP